MELVGQAKPSPDAKAGLENTSLQLFGKGGNWTGNRQVLWKEQELPERKQGKDTGHNLPPKQEGQRDNIPNRLSHGDLRYHHPERPNKAGSEALFLSRTKIPNSGLQPGIQRWDEEH